LKILFLLQDVPFPISDGMRWKTFHLLQYLSERHQCDVIAFTESAHPSDTEVLRSQLPNVNWLSVVPRRRGVARKVRAAFQILTGRPASLARYSSAAFSAALRSALGHQDYDVIHYDIINLAQYHVASIPSVHSPNDATSLFYQRMASTTHNFLMRFRLRIGTILIRNYEKNNYTKFSAVHVVSKPDASYLRHLVPNAHVVYIPFGVQSAQYLDSQPSSYDAASPLSVLVLGGANVPGVSTGIERFVKCCLPRLLETMPELLVRIQGRGNIDFVRRVCGTLDQRVVISDWVENLDELIRSATVVVLPDASGTGIKTRALQALACGAAIVGTSVAFEGIKDFVNSGQHCVIVDDDLGLIREVSTLLANQEQRQVMCSSATKLVCEQLSWDRLGPLYEDMYREAAAGV
jgi:glycosyltransferase involved in cell wall biosynthesis